jgi:hypothetical protein
MYITPFFFFDDAEAEEERCFQHFFLPLPVYLLNEKQNIRISVSLGAKNFV